MRRSLSLVLGAVLLGAAIHLAGTGELLVRLGGFEPLWFALALLVTIPQFALSAWRWRLISARMGLPMPFRRALAEYYVGGFVNLAASGGVGGDAFRIWRAGRAAPGEARRPFLTAGAAVVADRTLGQIALMLVVAAGWPDWRSSAAARPWRGAGCGQRPAGWNRKGGCWPTRCAASWRRPSPSCACSGSPC